MSAVSFAPRAALRILALMGLTIGLVLSLQGVAAASLDASYVFHGPASYSADGLGVQSGSGTLQADVPAGSTVQRAFLYESFTVTSPGEAELSVTLDGNAVMTTLMPNSVVGGFLSASRADVTDIVVAKVGSGSGIVDFDVTYPTGSAQGVALVVVYSNPSLPDSTVAILDGGAQPSGDSATLSFGAPIDKAQPGFQARMSLGIGFSNQGGSPHDCGTGQTSIVDVNAQRLTSCAGSWDDGLEAGGALMTVGGVGDLVDNPPNPNGPGGSDDELYDLSPFITNGDTSLTIETANASGDDNVFLSVISISAQASVTTGLALQTSAADAALGDAITDTATLAGGSSPTGTITFDLYGPGDTTCETPIFTSTVPVDAGNGEYASASYTPATTGSHRWVAAYSGDEGNAPVAGACGDAGETSTVKATPSISTFATPSAKTGDLVADLAYLAGGQAPTGTITFTLYGPDDATCTGTPAFTQTAPLGDSYTAVTYTPMLVGAYRWVATYDGDANNSAVAAPCNDANETTTVAKGDPDFVTQATASAAAGDSISDRADISGAAPTGTITFDLYGPGDTTCTGTPVFTTTRPVDSGNGSYTSASFTPAQAGAYRWVATYGGDANNASAAGACGDAGETSSIDKATPALSTTAADGVVGGSISDTATITGWSGPTGTITFTAYAPGDATCSGTPEFTTTTPVAGSGDYVSASHTPTAAGSHRWIASYGGDANNAPATGSCNDGGETSTVAKASATISTSATSAAVGRAIHDTATVTGPGSPTGVVTFTVHGPGDATCATAGTDVAGVTLSGGQARSADFRPSQVGVYRWRAHYGGDANNDPVDGACNAANETSTVTDPKISVSKSGPAMAHAGDTVTFAFAVTNPGAEALHAVTVTDDRCSAFSSAVDRKQPGGTADASPGSLDPGDAWTFSCSMVMPDGASSTNTATAGGMDPNGDDVPVATASHTTRIIHPAIGLAKSGPDSATAGTTVAFALVLTNPGDIGFAGASVKVTDDSCSSAPELTAKQAGTAADGSPDSLDPGDRWTYGCSAQTKAGDTQLTNAATAAASDPTGKVANASASATTALVQKLDVRAGTSAYVTAPAKCVTKRFRLDVEGTSIASVQFAIDGKKFPVVARPGAAGMWSIAIDPALRSASRHTVTALVVYTKASGTEVKTLTTSFKRCACVSRRAFPIRLRNQFHTQLRSASVYVNGKRARVLRDADALKAPIRLVGLPKGRVVVKIEAITMNGKHVSATRAYLTCAKKRMSDRALRP